MPIEGKTLMVVLAQLVEHRIGRGFEPHIPPKTAEIPFGIAAVFFVRMYGLETIVPLWLRTHFIGVPENFNSWGERVVVSAKFAVSKSMATKLSIQ